MTIEFQKKIQDAKELVKTDSVKKYIIDTKIERWVVVGRNEDYLVLINPFWCNCFDYQHGIQKSHIPKCKHIIAVQIAIKKSKFDTIFLSKSEYDIIRKDFFHFPNNK